MATSKIEWCSHTENPYHGCRHGCSFCYARRFSRRLAGHTNSSYQYLKEDGQDPFTPAFSLSKLWDLQGELRRAWKTRRVFLGSMGDLGGDWNYVQVGPLGLTGELLSAEYVRQKVWDMVSRQKRHTFLILTKNPNGLVEHNWPNNVHLGVSVSNMRDVAKRIPNLLHLVAGLLWVSVEPLLDHDFDPEMLRGVEWVVIGAETGPAADESRVWVNDAQRIVEWCKENMAAYKYPRLVEIRETLPMTATGKILKRELQVEG